MKDDDSLLVPFSEVANNVVEVRQRAELVFSSAVKFGLASASKSLM